MEAQTIPLCEPDPTPSQCELSLTKAYAVLTKIDKLVEKTYEAHSSIYKTFGDLAGMGTIRKDKSVAEAAHTDISNTLEALQSMISTLAQNQTEVARLEKKPREKLISDEIQQLLDEYSPYVRLMTERGNIKYTNEIIDGSVRELDISAMQRQIGDFGEGLTESELERRVEILREQQPVLRFATHTVNKRMRLLVVRIPTVGQMSISLKMVDSSNGSELLEVTSLHVFSDDEQGPFSKYQVFNRIAYDSNIIWFSISGFSVEHRLSKIVQWFSLFENLFSAACSVCNRHLQMDPRTSQLLPPLWRDVDIKSNSSSKAFHYGCLESN
ncbi:hypothetical protein GGI25_003400 [Coemansia spiralis]|uniref:Mediator of RNA polymerase II transcription subunit 27 n=2 Tax=Coemansia TaxID=4863 RepID=A0A9W8KY53_9FUNG|nr:hypothetical protein BX070DRAFT_226823 [Coemansia spiralis]KAJ1990939.1 hypothetical protein EDC05_003789 [Coemansia umbellata]KAJ2621718.1 hypothetical protein GGI26_003926 [Coemansia sp. RSA 1358]KAJ2676865.1 hypothetical protein GGI25_003400 [Coemansia spiralis]